MPSGFCGVAAFMLRVVQSGWREAENTRSVWPTSSDVGNTPGLRYPTPKEVGHPAHCGKTTMSQNYSLRRASLDLRQTDSSRSLFLDSRSYAKAKLPPLFRILIGHIAVHAKFPACHRLQVSSIVTVKDIPVESLPAGCRLERRRVYRRRNPPFLKFRH